ncbi:MAG TPA: hypothetical protein VL088_05705 [Pedobacter sp.]|nr:hypothetical protein [Pedobacter sp.]
MMKFTLWAYVCIVNHVTSDLAYIRSNYEVAVADKKVCKEMLHKLNKSKLSNVQLAYLGGFQTIWANHTFNPLTKLSTFKKGKANIDRAILNDQDNIETRFIRLSVQKNCPRFLGYFKNIQEDELYLSKHIAKVNDKDLKNMINKILKVATVN